MKSHEKSKIPKVTFQSHKKSHVTFQIYSHLNLKSRVTLCDFLKSLIYRDQVTFKVTYNTYIEVTICDLDDGRLGRVATADFS